MKLSQLLISLSVVSFLSACGGGGSSTTTGGAGAPNLTNRCSISQLSLSSGTTATLSKSSSSLRASMVLTLTEAATITITSNLENRAADDWIEAFPYSKALPVGSNSVTLNFDLNSPKKTTADSYTKFNVTAKFPDNTACVANLATNITLNP